jgi:hypothetical protein
MCQGIGDACPRLTHNCRARNEFRCDFSVHRSLIFQRIRANTGSDDVGNGIQIPPVPLSEPLQIAVFARVFGYSEVFPASFAHILPTTEKLRA